MARTGFRPNRPAIEIADVLHRHGQDYANDRAGHLGRVDQERSDKIIICNSRALSDEIAIDR